MFLFLEQVLRDFVLCDATGTHTQFHESCFDTHATTLQLFRCEMSTQRLTKHTAEVVSLFIDCFY